MIRSLIFLLVLAVTFNVLAEEAQAQSGEQEVTSHLNAIKQLAEEALEASKRAEQASTVAEVKQYTDVVFTSIWGVPSGISDESARGAAVIHDWKTRWQVDTDDFELEDPEKFGVEPAKINDPAQLGIEGRGRHVRQLLWKLAEEGGGNAHYDHVIHSLSNVIGWQRIGYADARGGMPRVDLTYRWDAPSSFWQSTADTGWILDTYSQAVNILKTNYDGDVEEARKHAADMTRLIEKALEGVDANQNGSVEPVELEGGLNTALQHAGFAGFDVQ